MKEKLLNAQRWLKQARHDLLRAERDLDEEFYSDACFMAEQASQKALKAFLFFSGERFVSIHALVKLVAEAAAKDKEFEKLRDSARLLDKYYIPTRYPDALPMPAVPFEEYDTEDAQEALACAREVVDLAEKKIGQV
ncbi:MAG: HEPN domain-containing protein [Candidatus Omnitrophica bacterium]|nr:HEPN domain-containing protein [Candidatus Omnitrophota bacterium]